MSSMPFLGQDPAVPPLAPEPAPAPGIEPDIVETQNFNTGAAVNNDRSTELGKSTALPY
jgi:hypothetical protein